MHSFWANNFLVLTWNFSFVRSSRPKMFCKGVLRNFAKFKGKHLRQSFFFNKVAGLSRANLLKEKLWHRFFLVNFAKFLRTPFLTEHVSWLLLFCFHKIIKISLKLILKFSWKFSQYIYFEFSFFSYFSYIPPICYSLIYTFR